MSQFVIVNAPDGYANALLNGSEGVIVHRYRDRDLEIDTVLLLSGPDAGREWQFLPSHLNAAPPQ